MSCQSLSEIAAGNDPFEESLWGEYARMLLVGSAACSAAIWGFRLALEPAALVMVVANVLVMAAAVSRRLAGLRRLAVLSLAMIGIVAVFAAQRDPDIWWSPQAMFSPLLTIGALGVLLVRDGMIALRARAKSISLGRLVVVTVVLAASVYMIAIPCVEMLLEAFRERPQNYQLEDLSPLEVLRIRSSKFAVFAIFAYAGACVGSFLNVVAASAPRGESIALRSSACPKCGTPIRRIDNLPIISYLLLRGRCRACEAVIPMRYFIVEWVGLAIFASLFLYELVTGAANVPGFKHYHYAGILWIILYTKWPVVGVYALHCLLFSCLLMLSLMEQDRLRAPRWMIVALPVIFAGIVMAVPTMLTVSLGDQTPFRLPATFPDWLGRVATSAAGGVLGGAIGYFANSVRLRRRQSSSSLVLAMVLLGVTLGWQAMLTIAVAWWGVLWILKFTGGRLLRPRWLTATSLLFVIAMLHHPAWKLLAGWLSF